MQENTDTALFLIQITNLSVNYLFYLTVALAIRIQDSDYLTNSQRLIVKSAFDFSKHHNS